MTTTVCCNKYTDQREKSTEVKKVELSENNPEEEKGNFFENITVLTEGLGMIV